MATGTSRLAVELSASVYPGCQCGKSWQEHQGACGQYRPSRPVEHLGVLGVTSPDRLTMCYWWLERFFHRLRRRRMDSRG